MFQNCTELEYLDLTNFNTCNTTDMEFMFNGCHKLKEIKGIHSFNTINVTNMAGMFRKCTDLKNLDVSNFNTLNTINFNSMFQECFELEYLDISNFNISNATDMENMFNHCHKLKEIKGINKFNISKVIHKDGIFEDCYELNNVEELTNLYMKTKIEINKPDKEINIEKKEITVHMITTDQRIKCSISCCNLDLFSTLMEKLFLKFPQLRNKEIVFLANGNNMKKNLSLEDNKIKDDTNIIIHILDE